MVKNKAAARKARGAAGIGTIEEVHDVGDAASVEAATASVENHHSEKNGKAAKAERKPKAKPESQGNGGFGVSDIKKAAAFANSIGGLDKAITLLQILKVAKEVQ